VVYLLSLALSSIKNMEERELANLHCRELERPLSSTLFVEERARERRCRRST
jgi:hypothetical protein